MTPEELKQAVEEFKLIYKEVFGVELNDKDATAKAQGLLELLGSCALKQKGVI
jgi:hypothetical protein